MVGLAKGIFKDDAFGRLQLISILHDFKNIDTHIYNLKKGTDQELIDIDELTWNVFYP